MGTLVSTNLSFIDRHTMLLSYSHLVIYGAGLVLVSSNSLPTTGLHRLPFSHADDLLIQIQVEGSDREAFGVQDLENYGLDVWKRDVLKNQILARIPKADEKEYPAEIRRKLLKSLKNYTFEELDINIDEMIQASFTSPENQETDSYDYNVYHDLDQVYNWMDDISAEHSDRVQVSTFGQSYENRDLKMMTIQPSSGDVGNNAIFVDCGIHAREWVAHAWCQHLVNYLLNNPSDDAQITEISEGLTWYIVPILNPDGYAYTWTGNRMWRKNRRINEKSEECTCNGVDLNRNYDSKWGGTGASHDCCADSFCGEKVFSEFESENERVKIEGLIIEGDLKMYLTFHSWSQLMIFPYGNEGFWSDDFVQPENFDELDSLCNKTSEAITAVYGTEFLHGQTVPTLGYPAAGGSDDWAMDAGLGLVYTFELRDQGRFGFLLPEEQIHEVAEEMIEGMKVMAKHVMDLEN